MMELAARTRFAALVLADEGLPARVADAFLSRYPALELGSGEARRSCVEDVRLHVSFLAGAIQAGSAPIFAEYATWCAQRLDARKTDRARLLEQLDLVAAELPREDEDREMVPRMIAAARVALASMTSLQGEGADDWTPLRLAYLSSALAGRRGEAWEVTREAQQQGRSLKDIYRELLVWSQRRLGELWVEAKITVAKEHMASSVTQSVVARLYAEIPGDRAAGRALITGVEGELHVLPAQLASDFLELDGWDVAFVGTHVPTPSILGAIEAERPDVLGLSTTMAFNLPKTVALVNAVRAKFTTLPIVLGGRAVPGAAALATELDVDVDPSGDGAAFRAYAR